MQVANKFMMLTLAVNDMPKAKEFYEDKLGLEVTQDYRQDDQNWWVSLAFPEGGVTITLSTFHEHMKPGTATVYVATKDVVAAQKDLADKGVDVSDVQDDLYGPGSGTKFVTLQDADGNKVLIVQE